MWEDSLRLGLAAADTGPAGLGLKGNICEGLCKGQLHAKPEFHMFKQIWVGCPDLVLSSFDFKRFQSCEEKQKNKQNPMLENCIVPWPSSRFSTSASTLSTIDSLEGGGLSTHFLGEILI